MAKRRTGQESLTRQKPDAVHFARIDTDFVMLRSEGWLVNAKRIYRLYAWTVSRIRIAEAGGVTVKSNDAGDKIAW
jgi:hypothetical protein